MEPKTGIGFKNFRRFEHFQLLEFGNSKENIRDKFDDEIDEELLNFIDKKLKMAEDKVNALFKSMMFNDIYDSQVRGIGW